MIKIRPPDKIAYLFKLRKLTPNNKIEKIKERIPINNKLYSISQIDKDGAQIKFNQNK